MTRIPEDTPRVQLNLSLPVDKQLSEGFGIAVIIHLLLFFGLIVYVISQPPEQVRSGIPLELIRLGLGNGPGSGGNLSPAGDPMKGPKPENPLEDASRQEQTRQKVQPATEYELGKRVVASNVSNAAHSKDTLGSRGKKNLGNPNGNPNGTGLAGTGNGPGSGLGFGLDWGGGGNRIVLNKVLPVYPPGVNKNAQIRMRFRVQPDGSVGLMIPTQKGDPRMEEAVYKALRQWRFNATPGKDPQQGEITFSFKVD